MSSCVGLRGLLLLGELGLTGGSSSCPGCLLLSHVVGLREPTEPLLDRLVDDLRDDILDRLRGAGSSSS